MAIVRIPTPDSSRIASIGHDTATRTLEVEFKGAKGKPNSVYAYSEFPDQEWAKFRDSESKGKFFEDNIRAKYPYIKVG